MNRCEFLGNLTKDFEYRVNGETSVARGTIALNRGKDKNGNDKGAEFVNLIAFGTTADLMDKYGKKGRKFFMVCHVKNGSYEKDGHKVYTTDFVIDNFEFCDSKTEGQPQAKEQALAFTPIPDDFAGEELPFA